MLITGLEAKVAQVGIMNLMGEVYLCKILLGLELGVVNLSIVISRFILAVLLEWVPYVYNTIMK